MVNLSKINRLFTHSGTFHTDDIFSTALLRILGCNAPVYRVPVLPELTDDDLAYDIGFGLFDHHQKNIDVRSDGIPYAAFGLLCREFKDLLFINEKAYQEFDERFVSGLDAHDNGVSFNNSICFLFAAFNPQWDAENPNLDKAFEEAVEIAQVLLKKRIEQSNAYERARDTIATSKQINSCLVQEKYAPINNFLVNNSQIKWKMYLSSRGDWTICSLRNADGTDKALLPEMFRGKPEKELPEGMKFCHRSGFLAAFESKEYAIQFAEKYL